MSSRVLNLYLNLDAEVNRPLVRALDNAEQLTLVTLIQGDAFTQRHSVPGAKR